MIDLRRHMGGTLDEMDVLLPHLYAEETTLLQLDARTANEAHFGPSFVEGPTIRRIDAPEGIVRRVHVALPGPDTGLRTARVFVLTSRKTASAAEHLALALKRTHRATVIGETTRGAGNFGDFHALPRGFKVFLPGGRAVDPDTQAGWEGTGVAPDVAVPAEAALRETLTRLGRDPAHAAEFDAAIAAPRTAPST